MPQGQTPYNRLFPPLPQDIQEPWWYASLQSFWLYWRVDPKLLQQKLPPLPEGEGVEVALFEFDDGERGGLVSLDLQRYTGAGPTYQETTEEVEFNIYVYPQARAGEVPLMSFRDFLRGGEQTKTIGGWRLHVPCDDAVAVAAGKGLYGEPKYLAVFDYNVPSLNGPPYPPLRSWTYSVYQDLAPPPDPPTAPHTAKQGPLIFKVECDLGGALPVHASPSPLIEYGSLPDTAGGQRLVANFWDFYGPFETYFPADASPPWTAEVTLGTDPDPSGTLDDLKLLIGSAQPVAAQVYASPPASAESRGWFVTQTKAAPAESFAELSAALTGFRRAELWGTGQVESYLTELLNTVGEPITARLLDAGDTALCAIDPAAAIQALILNDPDLGPVARNTIVMWYLGQWDPLPGAWRAKNGASPLDTSRVISAEAYRAGLAWTAAGTHPKGANPPGYGSWATAPRV